MPSNTNNHRSGIYSKASRIFTCHKLVDKLLFLDYLNIENNGYPTEMMTHNI